MSKLTLPAAMADLRPALPELVSQVQSKAPYATALLSYKQGLGITVDNREQTITEAVPSAGAVLSAYDGATVVERAVSGFDKKTLTQAAHELAETNALERAYQAPAQSERRGDFVTQMILDPLGMSIQQKLDACRRLQERVKNKDARIVNARVSYKEDTDYSVFVNSSADLAQRVQRVHLVVVLIVAGPDGQIRYDWSTKAGTGGWELLEFSDEDIEGVVKSATDLLSAERIEPGEYQVISAPGVTGTIAHESFGHGVETDMFLKERAKAAHFIDKTVGSSLVDINDDPSVVGGYGSYFFDDEGQLAGPTQIVEDGTFRRGITDFYSANALHIPRSANGRRQDFSRKAYARMSNTFFGPGDSTLDEMLAQVDHGIYLDRWSSGMEDPQGWGIQVTCHYGHEIKGGKITDRVFAPIVISGYVPEVLGSVSAVSNEVTFDAGRCGKGNKEIVPVASGGPHLLLRAPLG